VYTILFTDPAMDFAGFRGMGRRGGGMMRPDGKKVMQQFAGDTGARFFEVSKRMPIDKVFAIIEEDLRNQYSLGYSPNPPASAGYHRIHLTTRQKGLVVQTREGYYPS
jgi:VWFA-related protein